MESFGPNRARVALFRAREDAERTAARLGRLGISVARLPAVDIVPRPFELPEAGFDAVVATSAKAFLSDAALPAAPLYVVGSRTRGAAEAHGLRLAAPPAPDAARLVKALEAGLTPGASLLYLAGRDRKPALETALERRFALTVVETYAAEAREAWLPVEIRALGSCEAALHFSRRSAEIAARLARDGGAGAHFLALAHVCLSADVAEPLKTLGAAKVSVADAPDEPSLLARLREILRVFPSGKRSRI